MNFLRNAGRLVSTIFYANVGLNIVVVFGFFIAGWRIADATMGFLLAFSIFVFILSKIEIGTGENKYKFFYIFPGPKGWGFISVILIIAIGGIWFFGDQLLSATSDFRIAKFNRWSVEVDQRSVGERIYLIHEGTPYFTENLEKAGIAGPSEEGYYVNQKIKHVGEELIGLMLKNGGRFVNGTIVFVSVRDIKLIRVYNEQEQKISRLSREKKEAQAKAQVEVDARRRAEAEAERIKNQLARERRSKNSSVSRHSSSRRNLGRRINLASLSNQSVIGGRYIFRIQAGAGEKIRFCSNLIAKSNFNGGGSVNFSNRQLLCWKGTNTLFIKKGAVYDVYKNNPLLSIGMDGGITFINLPEIEIIEKGG